MAIRIKEADVCDSIVQNQELQIINFKSILANDNEQINLLTGKVSDLDSSLKRTRLKLKLNKKLTMFGIPTALLGGFIVGILLK